MYNLKRKSMKKFKVSVFLAVVLLMFVAKLNAQQCNLQGVVKYEYNDYIGYKIDEGAEIYIVSVSTAKSVDFEVWERYQELADKYMFYLELKNEYDYGIDNATIRSISSFSLQNEKELDSLSSKCFSQCLDIQTNAEYISLVDASGKYTQQLPYGEYYILAKSNNRNRILLPEISGRLLLEKVVIEKPTKILSFEFDY